MESTLADVKVTRGKEHNYLGTKLIFDDDGVIVDMRKYLGEMLDEFPEELTGNAKTPANDNLFRVISGSWNTVCQFLPTQAEGVRWMFDIRLDKIMFVVTNRLL